MINSSSMQCTNPYELRAAELDAEGDQQRALAKQDLKEAGGHAVTAIARTAGAAGNVVIAAAKVVQGTAQTVRSAGRITAAAGLAVMGAAASGLEAVFARPQYCAPTQQAQGLESRPSEKLQAAARKLAGQSGDDLRAAGRSYGSAVANVVSGVANVVLGAGHTLGVAGNLVQAGGRAGAAGRLELSELDARFLAALTSWGRRPASEPTRQRPQRQSPPTQQSQQQWPEQQQQR